MRSERNPLPLLAGVTRLVTWAIGISCLLVVVANVAAIGWLPGTSATPACADLSQRAGSLKDGAYATVDGTGVCTDDPTAGERLADVGDQVPQALFALGALVLLLRFLRTAAQEGPYAATVPRKLSALGWFVLAGAPLSTLLFAVSRDHLRASLTMNSDTSGWFDDWWASFPWWSTAAGLTALTFAYILRVGVRMREDVFSAMRSGGTPA